MAAITDVDVFEVAPNAGMKIIMVQTRNTVDAADTIAVNLANYGMAGSGFIAILGWKHTTDNSVVVTEAPTTSVTTDTLTITVPSGTDNDLRVYMIIGIGKATKVA